MVCLTYEEKNNKYRKDIQKKFSYLTKEIPLGLILPSLHEILHHSDYELLHRRSQNHSDWDCNQELLSRLQKREYWWRSFREALVSIDRHDIIERLGWNENTLDVGSWHENATVGQNSGAFNFEDVVNDDPTSATAFQEIRPQTSNCQSNIASMTTNDDVIKSSIASTVDPTGVSRRGNMRGEKTIRHKSLNLNREPDSYVTGLHSYGSDVTSSIRSSGQSSTLLSQDHDQTNVKTFGSITTVDALDDYNFNSSDLDSSSISSPDAMRLNSGSLQSAPSAADDYLIDPPGMEDLQHQNSSLAQNTSGFQDYASAQNLVGTLPNFDSLLSGSHQSLSSIDNQNLVLSDLPETFNVWAHMHQS